MGILEIIMIGIGLSMDAVAVSMSNGLACDRKSKEKLWLMPLFFGVFQGAMPLLGYFAGSLFASLIDKYAGIVIFLILGFIGGKMFYDGLKGEEEASCTILTFKLLIIQSIATSIDAFAVGVGFCAMQVPILKTCAIITLTTTVLSYIALFIGKKFGDMLGSKALLLGGTILMFIGIKALF